MNQTKTVPHTIVIRSWPKLIFLWPTALLALIAGILQIIAPGWENVHGATFLICLALNMIVLSFDFPRSTSLTVFIAIAAFILGLVLLNQQFAIIAPIKHWFASMKLHASPGFYFSIAIMMMLMYVAMAIVTRFDYWEVTSNELIHRTGLLGDVERFSTAGLKLNTEIRDVFEYVLAGAGRVIMNIPGNPRPVVLDNVLRIRRIMDQSKELLSRRVVEVAHSGKQFVAQDAEDQKHAASSGEYE